MKMNSRLRTAALIAACVLVTCALSACGKNTRKEKELREQAIGFLEQGDYSASVARFNEALSYHDGAYGKLEIDILRYRAEAEILADDYETAANTYAQLCREDGDKAEYMNLEVICMVRAGKSLVKALELYNKSTEAEPNGTGNRQALYVLGTALSRSEDPANVDKAKELYENALNSEGGKSGELYNRVGTMVFEKGDVDTALDWFRQGIDFMQNSESTEEADVLASLKYNVAICYEYKQDYLTAKQLFEEYEQQYGSKEIIDHEIDFLESRIRE